MTLGYKLHHTDTYGVAMLASFSVSSYHFTKILYLDFTKILYLDFAATELSFAPDSLDVGLYSLFPEVGGS